MASKTTSRCPPGNSLGPFRYAFYSFHIYLQIHEEHTGTSLTKFAVYENNASAQTTVDDDDVFDADDSDYDYVSANWFAQYPDTMRGGSFRPSRTRIG